ncbi:DUF2945 domain-containing protein [Pararhizobium sp. PWRC1-1]|uniref:DUF2945 domain-containing protein n=1 Tax=Pararhizobium sp. PWRC1-1 TaxID=2804566 RepID=UPI003CF687E3
MFPAARGHRESARSRPTKKDDKVEWETSQGKTEGKVVKKQTSDTKIKGHTLRATKSDPQMIVESTRSGK